MIPVYGVCYFAGMFAALLAALPLYKKRSMNRYDLVYSGIYAAIGGAAGAKILFILVSLKQIIELDIGFAAVLKGGFVFYGGLFGGMLGLLIYAKQFHLKFIDFFDIYAVVLPLGHAFGRVGCFFSGCCFGMHYDGFLSYTYTEAFTTDTPIGVPLLPIQLIEASLLVLLFAALYVLFLRRPGIKGLTTCTYLISYSVIRFTLEFMRGDKLRGLYAGLSTSQWISAAIFIVTVFSVIWGRRAALSRGTGQDRHRNP